MTPFSTNSPLDPHGDVSVSIVLFRTPAMMQRCLESFEAHPPQRVGQVVVVDNSADASSRDLDTRFPWIDYVENESNRHFRAGVNQAAALARLRYLLLLNPDTYLVDEATVAMLAHVLDTRPEVGFVGPKIGGDDGGLAPQGEPVARLSHLLSDRAGLHRLTARIGSRTRPPAAARHEPGPVETVTAAALLCRREQFLSVGGFDERARMYWEEHELSQKFSRLGLRGWYEPSAFVYHSWREGGTQLEPAVGRYFEQSASLYYSTFFGVRGRVLFRALTGVRRAAKRMLRR